MKKVVIFFGILNLLISLLYVNENFSIFLIFFIIFCICFIYCRKIVFKFFAKPLIKRISRLNKIKENLIKQINLLEKDKSKVNINEINRNKETINKLMTREKELKKQIMVLEAKKENLEIIIDQEKVINRAIKEEEKSLNILSNSNTELENKKVVIENEIARLGKSKLALENEIVRLKKSILPIKKKSDFINKCNINNIDNFNGYEFERFIAELLSSLGYTDSSVTKESGDYGIDVVAMKDGIKYAIQCKNYSQPVGNKAIQEAYSGKNFYDCHVAIVVTNNYFTANAINQAKMNKVILWDRDKLKELIKALT